MLKLGAVRVSDEEGMWVKELDKYESSVLSIPCAEG